MLMFSFCRIIIKYCLKKIITQQTKNKSNRNTRSFSFFLHNLYMDLAAYSHYPYNIQVFLIT